MDLETPHRAKFRAIGAEKFRLYLSEQLAARIKKNPRYSLRAFAKQLDQHPATLSRLLSGKRGFTLKTIVRIANRLQLCEEDIAAFEKAHYQEEFAAIDADVFMAVADWFHYALLEATFIKDFQLNPQNAATLFNLPIEVASSAIERLVRLKLLQQVEGRYIKAAKFTTNSSTVITSRAHKQLQRQLMDKARSAIDDIAQQEKDITSLTLALNADRLPEARELIKEFRRSFAQLLSGQSATRVYNLTVQLFPVSNHCQNKRAPSAKKVLMDVS